MGASLPTNIKISRAAINRRVREHEGGVFLLFKPDDRADCTPELMATVTAAVDAANKAGAALSDQVGAQEPMASQKGVVIELDWPGEPEGNDVWFEAFAGALETAGISGSLSLAPQAIYDMKIQAYHKAGNHLGALLAYTRIDPHHPPRRALEWGVEDATTAAICDHAVAWGSPGAARTYLCERTARFAVASPGVAPELARAVKRSGSSSVEYVGRGTKRLRVIELEPNGGVSYHAGELGTRWPEHLDAILAAVLRDPGALDYAICFGMYGLSATWFHDAVQTTDVPWQLNRHMWHQFVPAPFGIQVLTSHHMNRANNLADWKVTRVADGRFLVQARDLEPWLAKDDGYHLPPEDLLAAARVDFGAMCLTDEDIAADPHGWLRGRGRATEAIPGHEL